MWSDFVVYFIVYNKAGEEYKKISSDIGCMNRIRMSTRTLLVEKRIGVGSKLKMK